MARSYSIAALLTVMAIVAVALASIRNAMILGPLGADAAIAPVTGTIAGGIWGLGLGIWNRDHWGAPWRPKTCKKTLRLKPHGLLGFIQFISNKSAIRFHSSVISCI